MRQGSGLIKHTSEIESVQTDSDLESHLEYETNTTPTFGSIRTFKARFV